MQARRSSLRSTRALLVTACLSLALVIGCQEAADPETGDEPATADPALEIDPSEAFPGGGTTVERFDEEAFSQPAENLTGAERGDFSTGNFRFRQQQQGAGPHFSVAQCQACHILDGRGRIPDSNAEPMRSMLLKVAAPDGAGGFGNEPTYGGQLQTEGVDRGAPGSGCPEDGLALFEGAIAPASCGAIGEAFPLIEYEEISVGAYPDGPTPTLRQPTYVITEASYGPFVDGVIFSPRVAPPVHGMGLIGAIEEADIRALADPMDLDGDGISGRIRKVTFPGDDTPVIGRYSWKLGNPTVLAQTVGAFRGDIGVTSSIVPEESCTINQQACLDAAALEPNTGPGGVDVDDVTLAFIELYTRTLAVPMNRAWDPDTGIWDEDFVEGRRIFRETGCTDCHNPGFVTGEAAGSILGRLSGTNLVGEATPIAALSNQTIYPYTDLLLHDMGGACDPVVREDDAGETCTDGPDCHWVMRCTGLADGFPEGDAGPTEWRTAPLWGVGLAQTVSAKATFLHDGRARTLEEAILWHGGEAEDARDAFMALELAERLALIEFVESL